VVLARKHRYRRHCSWAEHPLRYFERKIATEVRPAVDALAPLEPVLGHPRRDLGELPNLVALRSAGIIYVHRPAAVLTALWRGAFDQLVDFRLGKQFAPMSLVAGLPAPFALAASALRSRHRPVTIRRRRERGIARVGAELLLEIGDLLLELLNALQERDHQPLHRLRGGLPILARNSQTFHDRCHRSLFHKHAAELGRQRIDAAR
jgi:hypothetical protein